jgi:PilZ domain
MRSPATAAPSTVPSIVVRQLAVHFPTKRHVLSAVRAEGPLLSMQVHSRDWLAEGTRVRVEVSLGDDTNRSALEGAVAPTPQAMWQRNGQQLTVRFQGEGKRAAAELVALCAGRPTTMGTAQRPRVAADVRCRLRTPSARIAARVRDLSATGAFVALSTRAPLRAGDTVELVLEPGLLGLGGTVLDVRVMWVGEKHGSRGLGVRFTGNPLELAPVLRKYLKGAA